MTEVQEQLFNKNTKLVHYLIKKRFGLICSDPNYDDCAQEGFIGLMKACETFDESKGYQFATYASTCISNEIGMYLRKSSHGASYGYRKIYKEWNEAREQGMTTKQFCDSTGIPQYKVAQANALMHPIELDMKISAISESEGEHDFGDIIADPSTIDGLHIPEEWITMPEIKSYIMQVADMYDSKYLRDIWIEYAYALIFCAETGGKFSEVQETKQKYLSKKYDLSQSYVSRVIKRGSDRLKIIIDQNGGGVAASPFLYEPKSTTS